MERVLSTEEVEIMDTLISTYSPKDLKWMIELAQAILDEADGQIKVGEEIEHQTGTVWVGDMYITSGQGEDTSDVVDVDFEDQNLTGAEGIQPPPEDRREGDTC